MRRFESSQPEEKSPASFGAGTVNQLRSAALYFSIAETMSSLGSASDGTPWSAHLSVDDLRRLRGSVSGCEPFSAISVDLATGLVDAVLPEALSALLEGPGARQMLCQRIARTLLDDPVSVARLQRLVQALQETQSDPSDGGKGNQPP